MQLPSIEVTAAQVSSHLAAFRHVLVHGPEGSGRSLLAQHLRQTLGGAVLIELPMAAETDAPAACLLHAAAAAGFDGTPADASGAPTAALREAIARCEAPVIVRLPGTLGALPGHDADADAHRTRVQTALRTLGLAPRIAWIVDDPVGFMELGVRRPTSLRLPLHEVPLSPEGWRDLAPHAAALATRTGAGRASPIVWRLAVGAVHVGITPETAAACASRPTTEALATLTRLVVGKIRGTRRGRDLAAFLQARRALPAERIFAALGTDGASRALLAQSVGYGDALRVNPQVRAQFESLLPSLAKGDRQAAAHALAEANRQDDGVNDPRALGGAALSAWVEKLHQLAAAGRAGQTEWEQQAKPWPDLYRERARHQSVSLRDFAGAAATYRACLRQFPDDDYAHHYLAWNLQRARLDRTAQRIHFGRAVELAPDNPWWNSRRICQLIEAGEFIAARRAWREALNAVDPDGTRVLRDGWLPDNLHRWVADAWLKAGAWYEARAVLEGLAGARTAAWRTKLERRVADTAASEQQAFDAWWAAGPAADPAWQPLHAVWQTAASAVAGLPVPACVPGPDGPSMSWSHPGIVLTIEIDEAAALWTARDHLTGTTACGATTADALDPGLFGWLERLRHA